ncbi:hypothetical protein [Mycobacteroides abscessus]|uniref:hypothetical protein n=1 Tax=Mycobacteroides abscessus TaxID=36809 RepID=UPI000C267AD9|nr:hypothetical protein [Mycobacteroides abscessus]
MDENEIPRMSEQDVWEYLHDDLGIPVARKTVAQAVKNREIVPTRLSGKNLFSRNKVHAWLESREQPEPGRPVRDRKPVAAQ